MARFADWLDLGRNTISSLTTDDLTGLYRRDWAETRDILLDEHRIAIDGQRGRVRRFAHSLSAILYGLVKRLSPVRRILFVLTFFVFFACLLHVWDRPYEDRFWPYFELALSFMVMTALLAMELIGKIKYRDELTLARDLQATLIPRFPPRVAEYDIAAFNFIANTVGGDLYDFVPLPDGRLAVLFGDASGHGMAAGLVMAVSHASFRTQIDIDPSPPAVINSLNRILCRTGTNRSFLSGCYFLLSPDGSFSAVVAGHPPILKVNAAGKIIEQIGKGSYPLGVKNGLLWEAIDGTLRSGERLVFHSDGLSEARNTDGREFGDAYIEATIGWNAGAQPAAMVEALANEWRKFTTRCAPDDDVSIAVIEKR